MEHTKYFGRLEDVGNYSLSNLKELFLRLPRYSKLAYPGISHEKHLRNCAMISTAYLTGGRISEVINIRVKDISKEEDWIKIRLPNLKNKKVTFKDCSANIKVENIFIKYLVKYYVMKIIAGEDPENYLFTSSNIINKKISRVQAYHIFTKVFRRNPHFLRKVRATHLLEYYMLDAKMLQQYIGWANFVSSEPYIRLSQTSIKKRYMENADHIKNILGGNL